MVTDDLRVAGACALAAIALTLALEFGLGVGSFLPRALPLAVYVVYAVVGKRVEGPVGRPVVWGAIAWLLAASIFLLYAV